MNETYTVDNPERLRYRHDTGLYGAVLALLLLALTGCGTDWPPNGLSAEQATHAASGSGCMDGLIFGSLVSAEHAATNGKPVWRLTLLGKTYPEGGLGDPHAFYDYFHTR